MWTRFFAAASWEKVSRRLLYSALGSDTLFLCDAPRCSFEYAPDSDGHGSAVPLRSVQLGVTSCDHGEVGCVTCWVTLGQAWGSRR